MLVGDDKIAALRESDVFILPSYTEAVSMATLEAMHFGLPVIVTKNSGLSSIIERDSAGLVVEKSINQVAEAVLEILRNSELAEKMGERGRELVNNEFSGAKVAEKFLKEYNEAIKNYEAPN
jgi:glycosyltransferase involved in cell wall biosynthesis